MVLQNKKSCAVTTTQDAIRGWFKILLYPSGKANELGPIPIRIIRQSFSGEFFNGFSVLVWYQFTIPEL